MIPRKRVTASVLVSMLILLGAGAASGAAILSSVDRIGQVVSPAGNSGSFPISSMLNVRENGQLEAIGPIPANEVFIVTRITGYFIAADPTLTDTATINLGDYYSMGAQFSNGFCTINRVITPGVPISNPGATVYLHLRSDPNKASIAGKLNLRLMGYGANIN